MIANLDWGEDNDRRTLGATIIHVDPRPLDGGEMMTFQVCRYGRSARWVVRLNDAIYGAYLDKEQALVDAIDAARDAEQAGCEAQVWVRARTRAERVPLS
jgi:hypothetical protein